MKKMIAVFLRDYLGLQDLVSDTRGCLGSLSALITMCKRV